MSISNAPAQSVMPSNKKNRNDNRLINRGEHSFTSLEETIVSLWLLVLRMSQALIAVHQ